MGKVKNGLLSGITRAWRSGRPWLIGGGLGVAYGIIGRLSAGSDGASGLIPTLSFGFLTLVPLGLGAVTVFFAGREERVQYGAALGAAITAAIIFLGLSLLLMLEIAICILMAAPIVLVASALGGFIMCWAIRQRTRNYAFLGFLLMLPYLFTPVEQRLVPPPDSIRTVNTEIVIDAPANTIWQNIIRVPKIDPAERGFNLLHQTGVPAASEATLDVEGVGGLRYATFDNGVAFFETITDWQPNEKLTFTIALDPDAPNPAPYNMIGGPAFEMLEATYILEPLDDDTTRVYLSSSHRLTTRFNPYGGLWTDLVMRDIQDTILRVVKARCEASA